MDAKEYSVVPERVEKGKREQIVKEKHLARW